MLAGAIEQRAENRHPDRAERNQSVFDFAAGKISGRDAADSDADSDRGLQIADVRFVNVQHVVAVDHDRELQQAPRGKTSTYCRARPSRERDRRG